MDFEDLIIGQLEVNKQKNILSEPEQPGFYFTAATQKIILTLSANQFPIISGIIT